MRRSRVCVLALFDFSRAHDYHNRRRSVARPMSIQEEREFNKASKKRRFY